MLSGVSAFISATSLLFVSLAPPIAFAGDSSAYENLFPYSALVCAGSRFNRTQRGKGDVPGHGFIYIKGMCRDTSAPMPKVMVCPEGTDLSTIESGVGVSADSQYTNVNWTTTQGASLFFYGASASDKTEASQNVAVEKAIQQAVDQGIFRNVRFKDYLMQGKSADEPFETFHDRRAADLNLGTDFGIAMARNILCTRIPLRKEMVVRAAAYLNALNEAYFYGKRPYKLDPLSDNCTHLVHNTIAAMGLWPMVKTKGTVVESLKNLMFPAPEVAFAIHYGNDSELDRPWVLYDDPVRRKLVVEDGVLPVQPGVISWFTRADESVDRIFAHSPAFAVASDLVLDRLKIGTNSLFPEFRRRDFEQMLTVTRYRDLRENLLYIRGRYEHALRVKLPIWSYQFSYDTTAGSEFEQFYDAYYALLERGIREIDVMLTVLAAAGKAL